MNFPTYLPLTRNSYRRRASTFASSYCNSSYRKPSVHQAHQFGLTLFFFGFASFPFCVLNRQCSLCAVSYVTSFSSTSSSDFSIMWKTVGHRRHVHTATFNQNGNDTGNKVRQPIADSTITLAAAVAMLLLSVTYIPSYICSTQKQHHGLMQTTRASAKAIESMLFHTCHVHIRSASAIEYYLIILIAFIRVLGAVSLKGSSPFLSSGGSNTQHRPHLPARAATVRDAPE